MAADRSVGFFGKLPVVGDFVVRRLSMAFVQQWDDWLQQGLAHSRETLGERWLNSYLVAPVWRFCLQPDVIDSNAWCGLMFPSVDRVGRYFPLTLFAPLPAECDLVTLMTTQLSWFDQLEALALQALDPGLQFEAWDGVMQEFPLPPTEIHPSSEDSTVPLSPTSRHKYLRLLANSPLESIVLLDQHSRAHGAPRAFWWVEESQSDGRAFQISEGLPEAELFTAFIDQDWDAHGWTVKQSGSAPRVP